MNTTLQAGLIGFGVAGRFFHAPLISSTVGLHLAKIVQRHGDEARRAYPEAAVVNDARAVIEDDAIDLVVIATPNTSHAELAAQALRAGKHVVVDKPFTITSSEAQRLGDEAQTRGRVLSVFHNRRWDADFLTLQRIVQAGMLGRVVEYEAHFDRFRPQVKAAAWREEDTPGSGILYDLGSHLIDQALCLFGLPRTVRGELRRQRDGARAPDYFEVGLGYEELKVTLKAGMLVREPGPQFIVHGTRGSFLKHRHEPQENALRNGLLPLSADWGRESREQWGTLNTELDGLRYEGKVESVPGCYQRYYQNVVEAITQGAALAVTAQQACDVIRVIELAMDSDSRGSTLAFAP